MKRFNTFVSALLFVFLVGLLPARAGAWRSTSGNVFRFQNDGSCSILQTDGRMLSGRWWWFNQPAGVFEYQFHGAAGVYQVQMQDNNHCAVYGPGGVTYWSRMAGRGAEDKDEDKGAASGWLMIRKTP